MSDWKRWRDDADAPDELRTLFAGGEGPRGMTAEERARARARATAMVGAGAAGFFAASAWARAMASGKLVGAVAFVTVATATTMVVTSHAQTPSTVAHTMVAASAHALANTFGARERTRPTPPPRVDVPIAIAANGAVAETTNVPDSAAALPAAVISSSAGPSHTRRGLHQSVAAVPHTPAADANANVDPLERESELVQEAMRSIQRDPAHALRLADQHAREFPNGQLAAERAYVRVRALARLGRMDEAVSEARALIEAHPQSEYAARLSRALESSGGLR